MGSALEPANHHFLRQENHYFLQSPPGWHQYAMAILFTLLLAATFFVLGRWARKPGHRWLHRLAPWGLLGASAVALNALRQHVDWLSFGALSARSWGRAVGLAALLALAVVLASSGPRGKVLRGLRMSLLALTPFCVVTFAQAAAEAWTFRSDHQASFEDKPTARPFKTPADRVRLVFLVFDGLDQHLLFSDRSADLRLPAFDRLRAESVSASQAYPVDHSTAVSLPSLITGQRVRKVQRTGADELYLWLEDVEEGVPWSEQDNLFRRTRALGLNGALLGWYHPYCRILARDLVSCTWFAYVPGPAQSLAVSTGNQLALLVDTLPLAARFDLLGKIGLSFLREADATAWFLRQYRAVHARALDAVRNPELSLVFVHYPVPHWPNVYDRFTGRFQTDGRGEYTDSLALTDRTLGEIREALSSSGLGERSAILLTSDHWHLRPGWRERGELKPVVGRQDQRVPLLLFLPGAGVGTAMDSPVMNVVAQDLALAVLRGELTTTDQAVAWLEARRITGHGP